MNFELEQVYKKANIECFDDKLKYFIKETISTLYYSNWKPLENIQIEHIDRAIFKYKEASKNKKIYNTKNYFIACLKSAVHEMEIDFI